MYRNSLFTSSELQYSLEEVRGEFDDFQESSRELEAELEAQLEQAEACLLYTSPSPRDATLSRMPSSA